MVLIGLIELIEQRAREIREFILLPWDDKKKRACEFWRKYGQLYIWLFIFATVVAFINVYIETSTRTNLSKTARVQLVGGNSNDDKKKKALNISSDNSSSDQSPTPETAQPKQQPAQQPVNNNIATNTIPNPTTESNKTTQQSDKNQASKNNITITTEVNTILPSTNSSEKKSKVNEIRERRKAKHAERASKSSIKDSLSSLGTNITAGISGGTGRALSVLGTFFSAILGLILFCCAPVVIFYLWMKKLIMPLFPAPKS